MPGVLRGAFLIGLPLSIIGIGLWMYWQDFKVQAVVSREARSADERRWAREREHLRQREQALRIAVEVSAACPVILRFGSEFDEVCYRLAEAGCEPEQAGRAAARLDGTPWAVGLEGLGALAKVSQRHVLALHVLASIADVQSWPGVSWDERIAWANALVTAEVAAGCPGLSEVDVLPQRAGVEEMVALIGVRPALFAVGAGLGVAEVRGMVERGESLDVEAWRVLAALRGAQFS